MNTLELRSYAAQLGIKVIGKTNIELLKLVNLPKVGDKVSFKRKKSDPAIESVYKGSFKCKTTGKFYGRMRDSKGRRHIKQLDKITIL